MWYSSSTLSDTISNKVLMNGETPFFSNSIRQNHYDLWRVLAWMNFSRPVDESCQNASIFGYKVFLVDFSRLLWLQVCLCYMVLDGINSGNQSWNFLWELWRLFPAKWCHNMVRRKAKPVFVPLWGHKKYVRPKQQS